MKLILTNGLELTPIMVTGQPKYIQGAERDSLTFVFDSTYSMDELDALFTEANCEKIILIEDGTGDAYMHTGYVIRTDLTKRIEVTEPATPETEEVSEQRILITMAQRTYAETKLAQVAQESTDTQLAVAELAELMMS